MIYIYIYNRKCLIFDYHQKSNPRPIVPHLGRMLAPLQSLPRKSRIDPEALMRAYETSYNQQLAGAFKFCFPHFPKTL